MHLSFFGISRNGEPIESHYVKHGVSSGITYDRLVPDLVPLFEEHEAMIYANYNLTEWRGLHWFERSLHVAQYRYKRLIELHGNDAVAEKVERDSKKRKR